VPLQPYNEVQMYGRRGQKRKPGTSPTPLLWLTCLVKKWIRKSLSDAEISASGYPWVIPPAFHLSGFERRSKLTP
jgi:hypothetical protein